MKLEKTGLKFLLRKRLPMTLVKDGKGREIRFHPEYNKDKRRFTAIKQSGVTGWEITRENVAGYAKFWVTNLDGIFFSFFFLFSESRSGWGMRNLIRYQG